MKKLLCIVIILIATICYFSSPTFAIQIGDKASDFTLKNIKDEDIKLSHFLGKVVLLNIWASWCEPCKEELPEFEKIYNKYKDEGLVILGVNIDNSKKNAEKLLEKITISFPIVFDHNKTVPEKYGPIGMPFTYLIDKKGIVRNIFFGYNKSYIETYHQEIKKLLGE